MKKRLVTIMLVSAMTVACLAGCSSSTDSSSDASSAESSTAEASTEEASTADTSTADAEGSKVVKPDVEELDMAGLADGTYHVAFSAVNVAEEDSGLMMRDVKVFTEDHYDIVDIGTLAVGDTIVSEGKETAVESLEDGSDGEKLINGGFDNGGITLITEEDSNGWVSVTDNDLHCYTEAGVTDLQVSKKVTYTDSADLDNRVSAGYDDLQSKLDESTFDYNEYNTSITVEDGAVVEIDRSYMP